MVLPSAKEHFENMQKNKKYNLNNLLDAYLTEHKPEITGNGSFKIKLTDKLCKIILDDEKFNPESIDYSPLYSQSRDRIILDTIRVYVNQDHVSEYYYETHYILNQENGLNTTYIILTAKRKPK